MMRETELFLNQFLKKYGHVEGLNDFNHFDALHDIVDMYDPTYSRDCFSNILQELIDLGIAESRIEAIVNGKLNFYKNLSQYSAANASNGKWTYKIKVVPSKEEENW